MDSSSFERDGIYTLPDFLDAATLATLNEAIAAHYGALLTTPPEIDPNITERGGSWAPFQTDVIPWVPQGEPFAAVAAHPALEEATRACIGEGFSTQAPLVMLTPPGGQGQAWHQDSPPRSDGHYNLNRLLYVRDVGPDDGAMVYVPGSHRAGLLPEGEPHGDLPGQVALMPKAGTLVLLHGHVFHKVTPCRASRGRVSVNFRAYPAGVSSDVCSIGIYRNAAYHFGRREVLDRQAAMR